MASSLAAPAAALGSAPRAPAALSRRGGRGAAAPAPRAASLRRDRVGVGVVVRAQAVETKTKPCAAASTSATNATASADAMESFKVGAARLAIALLPGESGLRSLAGVLPEKYKNTFHGLIDSDKAQMMKATGNDEARASAALVSIFKDMMKAYAGQLIGTPYEFPSHHICMTKENSDFDYYQMANAYIGSLVEFDRSIVRYPERFTDAKAALDRGENVVFLGNHQSEGDAAFIPLLTEVSHPGLGEKARFLFTSRWTPYDRVGVVNAVP